MTTIVTEQSWLHAGPWIALAKMDSDQQGDSTRAFTVASKRASRPARLRWGKMGKWELFEWLRVCAVPTYPVPWLCSEKGRRMVA